MDHFPVSKSFLQCDALARRIEEAYGLENVACQLISATLRDVYLVTAAQGPRVLYVYRHGQHSAGEIAAEWQLVNYLHASGAPVAPAVASRSGGYLLAFHAPEGLRHAVLTQFVPGEMLRRRSSIPAVGSYGKAVATIHALCDAMPFTLNRPVTDLEQLVERSVAAFEREAADHTDDVGYVRRAARLLLSRPMPLPKAKPFYGVIHGDVIRANAVVSDAGLVSVLDFDLCGFGWRAYDVASYLLTIRDTPDEQNFEQAFLEKYQQVRPLTNEERQQLPLFEAVRAIFSIGIPAMNIEHWGNQYFYAFLGQSLRALKGSVRRLASVDE